MNEKPIEDADLLNEYDFSDGVRGKYVDRVVETSHVILLETDVAEVFKDSESVNRALRGLLPVIRKSAEEMRDR
jgi:hypothetical protein